MSVNSPRCSLLLLVCLGVAAGPRIAGAVEGVVQISQAAVNATGFPYAISAPGRYRLVGNLTVPNSNTTAIAVAAIGGVEIDLNGFAILGPNTCTYSTSTDSISCTANGTGDGISASAATDVVVRNGVVRGMGSDGIVVGVRSTVADVSVFDNGGFGIRAGDLSQVTGGIAVRNQTTGIRVDGLASVRDSVVRHTQTGVVLSEARSAASGNAVAEIGGTGISFVDFSTIAGNVVRDALAGLSGGDRNTLLRNVSYQSRGTGLLVDDGNLLRDNVVSTSSSAGINVGIDNAVVRNVSVLNTGADIARDTSAGGSNHLRDNYVDDLDLSGGATVPAGNCCGGGSQFVFSGNCIGIPD